MSTTEYLDALTGIARRRSTYAAASCINLWAEHDPAEVGEDRAEVTARHAVAIARCNTCPLLDRCRADHAERPLLGAVVAGQVAYRKRSPQPARRATA